MKIKNLLTTLTLMAIFLFVGKVGWGQKTLTWQSTSSTDWTVAANWYDEGAAATSSTAPAATDIVVVDGTRGATAQPLLSGGTPQTIKKLTIGSGFTLTISSSTALANSTTGLLQVGDATASTNDIIIQDGGVINNVFTGGTGNGLYIVSSSDVMRIDAGGKYIHDSGRSFGTPWSTAKLDLDNNSTIEFGHNCGAAATLSGRTYGNLVLSATSAKTYTGAGGSATIINGTLTLSSSFVTFSPNMTAGQVTTINNFVNNGGTFSPGTNACTLNILGNVTNNGTFTLPSSGLSVFFDGSTTISGSGNVAFANGVTINATKSVTLGREISVSSGKTLTVNGTLDCGTNQVTGAGAFTLAAGGTLKTANATGLIGSIAVSGTKTYNAGSNFEFNGSVAQTTGVLPATVENLTINNANGVTLDVSTTVNGALTLTAGKLDIGSTNLTIAQTTGSLVGADNTKYIVTSGAGEFRMFHTGTGSLLLPVGPSASIYAPVEFSNNTTTERYGVRVKTPVTNASMDNNKIVNLEWYLSKSGGASLFGTNLIFHWGSSQHGSAFDPAQTVYVGEWNGVDSYTKHNSTVGGANPYTATTTTISTFYSSSPFIVGNAGAFSAPAPTLTKDDVNTVDNNIEITFTEDAAWRTAITDIKVSNTSLAAADFDKTVAGKIILKPSNGNTLLTTSGDKSVMIIATGYDDASVIQSFKPGAIVIAKSSATISAPLEINSTKTVTVTYKDQYENGISAYLGKFDVTITDADGTTDESFTVSGTGYTTTTTNVNLSNANASGVRTFDITIPTVVDGGDAVSVQVKSQAGDNIGTAFTYTAPLTPAATISPSSISEHSLNNAVITILLQNATFAATLDKANYILNNAPLGLTVASVSRTDATHANLTLAYDDAGNDFDTDVANFNVTIKVAELVGASADVISNNITLAAETEVAPTVTISNSMSALGETSVTWGGEATATGGEAVTEKGVCWGTAAAPTIAGDKTTEGAGLGAITGSITGLNPNTAYFVRAYATNSIGTAYSAEKTFRTYSAEPTNHVNTFAVAANAADLVLTWANNNGAVAPTHYLIKASTSDNITDPIDFGPVPAEKLTVGSNDGVKVVAAADATYTWTGLTPGAAYYFKIYPFTKNDDNLANYKIASVPAANATVNSDLKAITATTIGTLGATKISDIPATTTVAALEAAITVSPNATKDILVSAGGASADDAALIANTMVVKVTAQNGTSQNYTLELQVISALFYDGFTGTGNIGGNSGTVGGSANGWTNHSGTTGTIDIVDGNLEYVGLQASTGKKIYIPGANSTGRDVNAAVSVAGDVAYFSALINVVDNSQLGTAYDYFMHFGQTDGASVTVFGARLGAKLVTGSTTEYQLGILNTSGGTVAYTDWTSTLAYGTTYLVVVKLDKSTSPITTKLWVNPATLGGAEPAGSVTNTSGTNTFTAIKSICIRNGYSGTTSGTPKAHIDEIRVGTTFAEVTPVGSTDPTLNVSVTSLPDFGNIIQNTESSTEGTFNVSGNFLTNDIVITPPAGFVISRTSGTGFISDPITLAQTAGTVGSTPIYVRFKPTAVQAYSGNITVSSTGVTPSKTVAVSGTGISSDTEAPAFATGYPKAANIAIDKFDVVVNINEVGKVWFLRLASGATAPTVAEVKAGTLITVTAANTDFSSPLTGLTMNTTYDVYFVTEDNQAVPNTLATPVKLSVTTASIPAVSVYDIQFTAATPADSPYKGQQISTKGLVVAVKTGTSTSFYLQDGVGAWKGIYVYGSTTPVAVGDSVRFNAVVEEYFNLTELKTITNLVVINSNNTIPAPASVTVAQAGSEAYEGVLVKLTNVQCTVLPNNYKEWTVSDGTSTVLVDDFLYEYTPTQGTRYDITGVIDYSFSAFKVLPRSASDVSINTSAIVNPFATFVAYPNPFSNEIRFEGADVARVTVTSIIGQVVLDRAIAGENYINTQELIRGIYLVKFTNKKGESILRKLIKE